MSTKFDFRDRPQKLGSNLGPFTPKYHAKTRYITQKKARRASKIVFLMLPVTQEVASSSLVGPAKLTGIVGPCSRSQALPSWFDMLLEYIGFSKTPSNGG